MQFLLTPYAQSAEPYVIWENGFNQQELDWLQQLAKNANSPGITSGNPSAEELKKLRRSSVSWIDNNSENNWVFKKLAFIVSSLNAQFYRFDLTGFGEPIQLANYVHSELGMYGWHQDYGVSGWPGGEISISRKLSLVLQLTDPSQYEGGNLQILNNEHPLTIKKQRGLISVFPSYQLHQVTPVTQGSRQSLVAWISGPAFK